MNININQDNQPASTSHKNKFRQLFQHMNNGLKNLYAKKQFRSALIMIVVIIIAYFFEYAGLLQNIELIVVDAGWLS